LTESGKRREFDAEDGGGAFGGIYQREILEAELYRLDLVAFNEANADCGEVVGDGLNELGWDWVGHWGAWFLTGLQFVVLGRLSNIDCGRDVPASVEGFFDGRIGAVEGIAEDAEGCLYGLKAVVKGFNLVRLLKVLGLNPKQLLAGRDGIGKQMPRVVPDDFRVAIIFNIINFLKGFREESAEVFDIGHKVKRGGPR
jgi:hypothetical protein